MLNRKLRSTLVLGALLAVAGVQSAQATVTNYNVTQTYNQVVYDNSNPTWDTIFNGSFTFDSASNTVSNLTGSLSAAMTGNSIWTSLTHQLSVINDGTSGLIVTVFKENSTNVFQPSGFASTGKMGPVLTYGNYNAFASIYIPLADPTMALSLEQTDKLAYGDCTSAGLMGGNKCMTGWNAFDTSGNRIPGGTMRGTFPNTQTITAAVPEPETYAMLMAGLGLIGLIARRRKTA